MGGSWGAITLKAGTTEAAEEEESVTLAARQPPASPPSGLPAATRKANKKGSPRCAGRFRAPRRASPRIPDKNCSPDRHRHPRMRFRNVPDIVAARPTLPLVHQFRDDPSSWHRPIPPNRHRYHRPRHFGGKPYPDTSSFHTPLPVLESLSRLNGPIQRFFQEICINLEIA